MRLAPDDKLKELADELASEEGRQHLQLFDIAKQMVRQDVSSSSYVKDKDGILVTDIVGVKEV